MLEPILKGLVKWIYGMLVDIMAYASGELIKVMSMDLTYFEQTAPIITSIVDVIIALGWALLLGNLVFQSIKVMVSGMGFESEDPKSLFVRTFIFAFLLLCSRQICEIGMNMTGTVINMLEIPSSLDIVTPDEGMFDLGASAKWLLVIIVGVILMFQLVKLLFEIGERYVITCVLTFFAPLAFSMGGSKNTLDIFKGWCRMYGSMMIMMLMNIVFLKLILSAMTQMTNGGVLIWMVFVVALARVARKIDNHIGQLGLNPAKTGDGIGSRIPGMMTMVAIRTMASAIGKSGGAGKGGAAVKGENDSQRRSGFRPTGSTGRNEYNSNAQQQNQTTDKASGTQNTGFYAGGSQNSQSAAYATRNQGKSASSEPIRQAKASGSDNGGTPKNPDGEQRTPYTHPGGNASPLHKNAGGAASVNVQNGGRKTGNDLPPNMQSNGTPAKGKEGGVRGGSYGTVNRPPLPRNPSAIKNDVNNVSGTSDNTVVNGGEQLRGNMNLTENKSSNHSTGGASVTNTNHSSNEVKNSAFHESARYTQNKSTTMEGGSNHTESVNHQYKNGKYNPAAQNKKAPRSAYKKQTEHRSLEHDKIKPTRKKRGGGNNRKQK